MAQMIPTGECMYDSVQHGISNGLCMDKKVKQKCKAFYVTLIDHIQSQGITLVHLYQS